MKNNKDNIHVQGFVSLAISLLDIKEKIRFLKKKEDEVSGILKQTCDHNSYSAHGHSYSKIFKKGSIQYKDIEILKSIDLDEYRSGNVEVWNLTYSKQFDNLSEEV